MLDEHRLIQLIEDRREVWDTNSVQFRNKIVKSTAWNEIAKEIGATIEDCQNTWKRLRDRYTRNKRLAPSGAEGGRKKWDKEDLLRFLDKILVTRRTTSSATERSGNNKNIQDSKGTEEEIDMEDLLSQANVEVVTSNSELFLVDDQNEVENEDPNPQTPVLDEIELLTEDEFIQPQITPSSSKGKKRKRMQQQNKNELSDTIMNAINKLSNEAAPTVTPAAETDLNDTFIQYICQQAKGLLSNQNEKCQRLIRLKINNFFYELSEEYQA
ncbi:uncharacterized protein LOC116160493 isoform X1 [Photinus pyralis]|uniref:uncharacterized protein LOC116160493 isoform X1 n=1 Tax=Photinus pyralis TaxID=7054 RepID=UPI0012675E6A|nr:uncharacterized protein LOC116160493 isoform X1 [Photinus pyralis]